MKKIFKTLLLGGIILTITLSFSSCDNYDNDEESGAYHRLMVDLMMDITGEWDCNGIFGLYFDGEGSGYQRIYTNVYEFGYVADMDIMTPEDIILTYDKTGRVKTIQVISMSEDKNRMVCLWDDGAQITYTRVSKE